MPLAFWGLILIFILLFSYQTICKTLRTINQCAQGVNIPLYICIVPGHFTLRQARLCHNTVAQIIMAILQYSVGFCQRIFPHFYWIFPLFFWFTSRFTSGFIPGFILGFGRWFGLSLVWVWYPILWCHSHFHSTTYACCLPLLSLSRNPVFIPLQSFCSPVSNLASSCSPTHQNIFPSPRHTVFSYSISPHTI